MKFFLRTLIAFLACAGAAHAQYITQSGSVSPGHLAVWTTSGVVQDGGAGAATNITAVPIIGNGGTPLTISNFKSTNSGGYAQMGFGISSTLATISLTSAGGFAQLPFSFQINGNNAFAIAANGAVSFPVGVSYASIGLNGATSGVITLAPQANAGTYNFNFPVTAGSAHQPLLSGGGGSAPETWGTLSGSTSEFGTVSGALTSGHALIADASGNIADAGAPPATGTVSAGSTSSLAYYTSSAATVFPLATANNGVLVTSGSGVPSISTTIPSNVTVSTLNGVAYPSGPSNNTVPVVTSSNTITYEAVPNAAIANPSTTVAGQTCTLGSTCAIAIGNLSTIAGGTVVGNNTTGSSVPAATISPVLGIAGTSTGTLGLSGATAGVVTVQPIAPHGR